MVLVFDVFIFSPTFDNKFLYQTKLLVMIWVTWRKLLGHPHRVVENPSVTDCVECKPLRYTWPSMQLLFYC